MTRIALNLRRLGLTSTYSDFLVVPPPPPTVGMVFHKRIRGVCWGGRRGNFIEVVEAKFDRAGAFVGVAWDATAGALLVSVDGSALAPVFPSDVAPGPVVGAGLYPAVSGQEGCRVRWNVGQHSFRHPPPPGFLPCAAAAPGEPRVRCSHVDAQREPAWQHARLPPIG